MSSSLFSADSCRGVHQVYGDRRDDKWFTAMCLADDYTKFTTFALGVCVTVLLDPGLSDGHSGAHEVQQTHSVILV